MLSNKLLHTEWGLWYLYSYILQPLLKGYTVETCCKEGSENSRDAERPHSELKKITFRYKNDWQSHDGDCWQQ